MTVAALPNYKTFVGAGTTGPFTFAFTFDSNTEISCTTQNPTGPLSPPAPLVLLSPASEYTVTGAGSNTGGSVTLTTSLAVGTVLTVTRTLALAQDTSLPNQGPFFSTTVEYTFDRTVKMAQQLLAQQQLFEAQQLAEIQRLYRVQASIFFTAVTSPTTATFVEADASAGNGGAGIDGGIIGATVQYSGSGLLTVTKVDNTQYLVAVLPPVGWTICGRTEYDLSVGGESASFYPSSPTSLSIASPAVIEAIQAIGASPTDITRLFVDCSYSNQTVDIKACTSVIIHKIDNTANTVTIMDSTPLAVPLDPLSVYGECGRAYKNAGVWYKE